MKYRDSKIATSVCKALKKSDILEKSSDNASLYNFFLQKPKRKINKMVS